MAITKGLITFIGCAALASCTLAVDAGSLAEGEPVVACGDDEKSCPDPQDPDVKICVDLTNPSFGCASEGCTPCSLPNAQPRCSNQTRECQISSCVGSNRDCDDDDANGCEVNIATDEDNCGACDNACSTDGGAVACASGTCQVTFCFNDTADCDDKYTNGCEVDLLSDVDNCGECGNTCSVECVAGGCDP